MNTFILNRFPIKQVDWQVCEYECILEKLPESGNLQKAINRICYQLGQLGEAAARLGNRIITKTSIANNRGDGWRLKLVSFSTMLDCSNDAHRKALESLERSFLQGELKKVSGKKGEVERIQGVLVWWRSECEKSGKGWEIHRGRQLDVHIHRDGKLYLEVDVHFRFYSPWTLQQWLEFYPDSETSLSYLRNTYDYKTWVYDSISKEKPTEVMVGGRSLAEYHLQKGAKIEEIQNSRVVYVREKPWVEKKIPHLSTRLSPSLTLEMLSAIAEDENTSQEERREIREVFQIIKPDLLNRIQQAEYLANWILGSIYKLANKKTFPQRVNGIVLPSPSLLAANGIEVTNTAQVFNKGCVRVGETKFGCLNLYNRQRQFPPEIIRKLESVAAKNQVQLEYSYRTGADLPEDDLGKQRFWENWAKEEIKTCLVVMPQTERKRKQEIRKQALKAGIATQFLLLPEMSEYKAVNVVLGMLCKAGWQTVRIQPEGKFAELVIGFDTGTNRRLYYGTSAFAILADGQVLGWELPDAQKGESFSGETIWHMVSSLVLKFENRCNRSPRKVLLMRDGLVQTDEFNLTIRRLASQGITVDLLGIRKSGTGRMGILLNGKYEDPKPGSTVLTPEDKSFLIVTHQKVQKIGSVRPLKVVHHYGNTPLETLAKQTYHLACLHPASGFSTSRLPWVLHLADRSSKEFQRLGQISIVERVSREKLIAV